MDGKGRERRIVGSTVSYLDIGQGVIEVSLVVEDWSREVEK